MAIQLKTDHRNTNTKHDLKELRASGKIPGVLYGKAVGSALIMVDEKELIQLLRTAPGAVLDVEVNGAGTHPAMLGEVQRDKLSRKVLHIDLRQINMNENIRANVRIELVGEPAGAADGGILQGLIQEVEVRCLPQDLPATIEADVSGLQVGEHLYARDLVMPTGVELRSNPDDLLATVLMKQKDVPQEKAEAQKEAAEAQTDEAGVEATTSA